MLVRLLGVVGDHGTKEAGDPLALKGRERCGSSATLSVIAVDLSEIALDGLEPELVGAGLVHERSVKLADLAGIRAGGQSWRRRRPLR